MDDSKLVEENNINRDENDDRNSKDITMTDVGVENEGLNNLQETQNLNNDISMSNGEKKVNEVQSPVESVDTYEENESEQPAFSTLEKEATLDPISASIFENAGEIKSVSLDEGEKKNKSNEVELDQEIGKKEEEMNGEEASKELFPENERNGESLKSEVKLTEENKKGEEKMVSDSNGLEFNGDTEIKENNIENMESESELPLDYVVKEELSRTDMGNEELNENEIKKELPVDEMDEGDTTEIKSVNSSFLLGPDATEDDETGTIEEQLAFMKELEIFHKERYLDFRPPRFYQEPLNLLKLWRAVVRLGGYETVTSCKHWRQIGESFKPPKTCTTVSWTFRSFYEKALLEYEKHKLRCGELPYTDASFPDHIGASTPVQALGAGRQRRDAAARAMQGWHSRLHGNGDVGDTTIKDKCSTSTQKREKPLKSIGLLKHKMPSPVERVNVIRMKTSHPQSEADVIDIGRPANWVKINVQRTKDCFEVYALVPGLLREEVRVQSDAVGRLVISGEPDQLDNPWGVTPFRKVVSLPSRIDPHQTSAVVTLHGQLFVRVPFDPLDV